VILLPPGFPCLGLLPLVIIRTASVLDKDKVSSQRTFPHAQKRVLTSSSMSSFVDCGDSWHNSFPVLSLDLYMSGTCLSFEPIISPSKEVAEHALSRASRTVNTSSSSNDWIFLRRIPVGASVQVVLDQTQLDREALGEPVLYSIRILVLFTYIGSYVHSRNFYRLVEARGEHARTELIHV
jgi:hypothetical protein